MSVLEKVEPEMRRLWKGWFFVGEFFCIELVRKRARHTEEVVGKVTLINVGANSITLDNSSSYWLPSTISAAIVTPSHGLYNGHVGADSRNPLFAIRSLGPKMPRISQIQGATADETVRPMLVNQGVVDHPWQFGRGMTQDPEVHSSAVVENTRMWPWSYIGPQCAVADSEIREYAYAVSDNQIYNSDVGKFCNVASSVRINPTNHPLWRPSLHHFTYRSLSHQMGEDDPEIFEWRREHRVVIGPDVWIGHGAIVLPGVSIGAGAVIGAGAIVTKNIAPYSIAVGSPARVVRRRVEPATEAAYMRIAWWDWPHGRLTEALADFRKLDAAQFALKYDPGS